MEDNISSIIPKEAVLARLGKLIDDLNSFDFNRKVEEMMEEIRISCISPFAIPNWPCNFEMGGPITIRKEILYPSTDSKTMGGISLRKALCDIRVYIYDGYLHIQTEEIRDQRFKIFGIKISQQDKRVQRVPLESYYSSSRCGLRPGEFFIDVDNKNKPQNIACCLIIFCQLIDEVCEGIEKVLQKQLENNGKVAEQCRAVPEMVRRLFEPLIPFVVADTLSQE